MIGLRGGKRLWLVNALPEANVGESLFYHGIISIPFSRCWLLGVSGRAGPVSGRQEYSMRGRRSTFPALWTLWTHERVSKLLLQRTVLHKRQRVTMPCRVSP